MPIFNCMACKNAIYETDCPITSGRLIKASEFKSLNPEVYEDPLEGSVALCPFCSEALQFTTEAVTE